jgi:hypothetical protein
MADAAENVGLDVEIKRKQYGFNGAWLPDVDPLKVGEENFSDINNFRYTDDGLQAVLGYSKITSNPIPVFVKGRAGAQLKSLFTITSYVLVQSWNAALDTSQVFVNKAVPPATGDFEVTPLYSDAVGSRIGGFYNFPNGQVLYCNGTETLIYGGEELPVAAFLRVDAATGLVLTNPVDFTDEMSNTLRTAGNLVTLSGSALTFLVASTRPLSSIKLYVHTPNGTPSTWSGYYWDGSAWAALGGVVDGTASGGVAGFQTGTISFNSTVTVARPAFIEGMLLYFYKFTLSAGSVTLYQVTVHPPMQPLVNLWDGIYRYAIQCQDKRAGVWEDYTAEVAEASSAAYPIAALWGDLTNTDEIILMFQQQTTAVDISFIAGKTNNAAATLTVYYWNGSAWASVGTINDGTLDSGGTKTLSKSGFISWNSPSKTLEKQQTLFNVTGYAYKLVPSGALTGGTSHDGVSVDTLFGVPAPDTMGTYEFGFTYKNRPFLAGNLVGKKGNVIDFGMANSADVYNGTDSSSFGRSIYVGNTAEVLTCATNIFNRFGANIYNSELILQAAKTFLLDGDSIDNFKLYTISEKLGCPAPKTLTSVEIAYEITKGSARNIALWLSARGPVVFDTAVVMPIPGISNYFNPVNTECINYDAIAKAHAWYDPMYSEWNLCIPSGAGQQTCNVWVFYDLVRKRWSKRSVGIAAVPQATFPVSDQHGNTYIYGLFDDGHLRRLEHGNYYDTVVIECDVTTGDIVPSGDIWNTSLLRRIKMIRETPIVDDINYTRNDISFRGNGYATGYLYVYGEVVEDPAAVAVSWVGDNLVCAEVREGVALGGLTFRVTGGLLELANTIEEHIVLLIRTTAGNFVTAGFVPGIIVHTTDPDNPGPFTVASVSADTLTLTMTASARGIEKLPGPPVTLTAVFVKIEHYLDGATSSSSIPISEVVAGLRFQRINANCNYTGFSHRLKFSFNSAGSPLGIKPLAWGFQYQDIREDV